MAPRANSDWDDAAIITALQGNDDAREEAIDAVNAIYGRPICGKLRRRVPTLSSHELLEIWDDTLLQLWKRRGVEPRTTNGSLYGLLDKIAWCRTVDLLRRRSRWQDVWHQLEEVLETVAVRMQADPVAFAGLLEPIIQEIQRLTPKRRIVWETYAGLGFQATLAELTAAVAERLGEDVSETTVRKRLEAGRGVLRERLKGLFREWFGDWFDSWLQQQFDEWSERKLKTRREEVTDTGDGDESDGQARA